MILKLIFAGGLKGFENFTIFCRDAKSDALFLIGGFRLDYVLNLST